MLPHKGYCSSVFGGLGRKPLKLLLLVVIVDHSVMKAMADHWHWCSLESCLTFPECPLGPHRGFLNLLKAQHYQMELLFIHAREREREGEKRVETEERVGKREISCLEQLSMCSSLNLQNVICSCTYGYSHPSAPTDDSMCLALH